MGVSIDTGSKGGRRGVDAELNLIPFIDLLSVCILFLLMTAVWVQISKMSAFSQPSGEATVRNSEISNITTAKEDRDWDVLLRKEGVQIVEDGKTLAMIRPEQMGTIKAEFEKLLPRLEKIENPKISLRAEDEIIYENLIRVLDTLFVLNLTNVTIGGMN